MTDDTTLLEHFLLEHPEVNLIHQRADLPNVTSLLDRCEVDLAMTVLPPRRKRWSMSASMRAASACSCAGSIHWPPCLR